MKASVIIPVFNEGERVLAVAEAALGSDLIREVIVVNDGSTDHTADHLETLSDATMLTHPYNQGKGQALNTGMQFVRDRGYDTVVLLDGDLQGVHSAHIDQLLEPLKAGALMSIGYLGERNQAMRRMYSRWGALSGQRALVADKWDLLTVRDKHGFNVEAALNARFRKANLHRSIARIALENVSHVGKREKQPSLMKASWAYTKTYGAAVLTYARIELEHLGIK